MINNRKTGSRHEDEAVSYLESKGHRIIARNELNRFGEIDIISFSPEGILVFTEVKYRNSEKSGNPLEAVDQRKIRKICRASLMYINCHKQYSDHRIRYDVIGISPEGITHIENAFDYTE